MIALAALFMASVAPAVGQVNFSGPTNFPAGQLPTSVAVGDFNSDSHPDLAVANQEGDNISILMAAPGGSFSFSNTRHSCA